MITPSPLVINLDYHPTLKNNSPLNESDTLQFAQLILDAQGQNQRMIEAKARNIPADVLPTEELCKRIQEKDHDDPLLQEQFQKHVVHHSSHTPIETEMEHRTATQQFLDCTYRIVQFLRKRGESADWECDLSWTISLMNSTIEELEERPLRGVPPEAIDLLKEERDAHRNFSSELFVRSAFSLFAEEKKPANINLLFTCAFKCIITFQALSKSLESQKAPTENYKMFALRVMAFGHAFRQFKQVATESTNHQLSHGLAHLTSRRLHNTDEGVERITNIFGALARSALKSIANTCIIS